MSGGFILLHRRVFGHPVFSDEPFTEREAWIWLLCQASYEPHKIRYNSEMITVGRGEVPTSYRKLKECWKWGNERVRRFLDLLESEKMISRKTGTGFLVIIICNYDEYQLALIKSGTLPGTLSGTLPGTQAGTNIIKGNKGSNERNNKTSDVCSASAREIFEWLESFLNSTTPLLMAPVTAWLGWGADFELDVKPVAERWKRKNPDKAMNSLAWLNDEIAKSIKQRNAPMPDVELRPPKPDEESAMTLEQAIEFQKELNS